jgi:asparagine synthase (glutamine-hydrolysing)
MKLRGWNKTAFSGSAIHPDFARRYRLHESRATDPEDSLLQSPLNARLSVIKPGRNFVGALHNERGMSNGMEVRDPSSDARVLALTLSVPDGFLSTGTPGKTGG